MNTPTSLDLTSIPSVTPFTTAQWMRLLAVINYAGSVATETHEQESFNIALLACKDVKDALGKEMVDAIITRMEGASYDRRASEQLFKELVPEAALKAAMAERDAEQEPVDPASS